MRGVSALGRAVEGAREDEFSLIVIWEPVLPTDRRPPGRSVTRLLRGATAMRFWDPELLASQAMVRTALKHPELLPEGFQVDETTIVWDVVATWPAGVRWDDDPPWPEWFAFPVVRGEEELARRLPREGRAPAPP